MAEIKFSLQDAALELVQFRAQVDRSLDALKRHQSARPGATPRECVFQQDRLRLYRYESPDGAARPPILMVYALVNRPEMADLESGRSLIGGLIERGFDVYLIDWGEPGEYEQSLSLADYISGYINACVDYLCERLQLSAVSLLGICQGGTLALCYAALFPDKVSRLITTVTPIDFHTDNDVLSRLVRHIDMRSVFDVHGNLSGDFLNALFLSLKPYRLQQQKYLNLIESINNDAVVASFIRMEHWIFDSPSLPATAGYEFATRLYQDNQLVKGVFELNGQRVDFSALDMPVLNIYARDDHLVPPAASRVLAGLVKADNYTEHELAGGHIGVYVSRRAGGGVPALVAQWFSATTGP